MAVFWVWYCIGSTFTSPLPLPKLAQFETSSDKPLLPRFRRHVECDFNPQSVKVLYFYTLCLFTGSACGVLCEAPPGDRYIITSTFIHRWLSSWGWWGVWEPPRHRQTLSLQRRSHTLTVIHYLHQWKFGVLLQMSILNMIRFGILCSQNHSWSRFYFIIDHCYFSWPANSGLFLSRQMVFCSSNLVDQTGEVCHIICRRKFLKIFRDNSRFFL